MKYNEKEIKSVIDFYVLRNFQKETGIKLSDIDQAIQNLEYTNKLCWLSIKRAYILEGYQVDKIPIKEEDVDNILTTNYAGFLEIFNDAVTKMFAQPSITKTGKKKLK